MEVSNLKFLNDFWKIILEQKNVIFVLKSYSSIFWVIKNERFVGMKEKKLFKVLTCNIKSYSSNFSYGKKKVILGLKIIPALFVAILYKVEKKVI